MRKVNLIILLIGISILLNGCMSSPERRYYQLHLSLEGDAVFQTIDKVILIDRVGVDDLYDDFRIVYRISPYQLNFYSYEFWGENPSKLVRDAITHYLLGKRVFQKVIQEISKGDPDFVLRSKILKLSQYI